VVANLATNERPGGDFNAPFPGPLTVMFGGGIQYSDILPFHDFHSRSTQDGDAYVSTITSEYFHSYHFI